MRLRLTSLEVFDTAELSVLDFAARPLALWLRLSLRKNLWRLSIWINISMESTRGTEAMS